MYYKKINLNNTKECFDFLNKHFRYDTLSCWNGLKSIANNVKFYNLKLDGDYENAMYLLEYGYNIDLDDMIHNFEIQHSGYKVHFNGRSGGYLVLYNEHNNRNVLPDELLGNYEDFKQYCKEYYGSIKNYANDLRYYVKLVQDFDKLCDDLRDFVNELSLRDAIKEIVTAKLDCFVEEYKSELDKNTKLTINNDNVIIIPDKILNTKSLYRCLLNALENDGYRFEVMYNKIIIK